MLDTASPETSGASGVAPPRVLAAIASYGHANDRHLARLIEEYRSMPFDVDIVVLSNLEKRLAGVEVLVGLPEKNPWSLPFRHKALFAERRENYDLFVYSEDDILLTEKNLRAFLAVSEQLRDNEVAGFLRFELGPAGAVNYPDVHGHFHWNPASATARGPYTVAQFTNDHTACYVLSRRQLRKAIESGGFLVRPHEWTYDLLCSAAIDPYTQCGLTKLIPISHFDDFLVHHLSNKYAGRLGIGDADMRLQVDTLSRMSGSGRKVAPLLQTRTNLWHATYPKDYYEPVSAPALAMVPARARSILSIGCGSGATERRLAARGLRVVAAPLDPIIGAGVATAGVEVIGGDLAGIVRTLAGERFDCVLLLNVLHLCPDPESVLSASTGVLADDAAVIIQAPNMFCAPDILKRLRHPSRFRGLGRYRLAGVHATSPAKIRRWCRRSGLRTDAASGIAGDRAGRLKALAVRHRLPNAMMLFLASDFITVARRGRDGSP